MTLIEKFPIGAWIIVPKGKSTRQICRVVGATRNGRLRVRKYCHGADTFTHPRILQHDCVDTPPEDSALRFCAMRCWNVAGYEL